MLPDSIEYLNRRSEIIKNLAGYSAANDSDSLSYLCGYYDGFMNKAFPWGISETLASYELGKSDGIGDRKDLTSQS